MAITANQQRRKPVSAQTDLFERGTWGGRRPNAGRKKALFHRSTPHVRRPRHAAGNPLHVTLRALSRGLRRGQVLACLRQQVKRVREEAGAFQIVHYSLQDNHLHLIVEAKDKRNLSLGMLGFAGALARAINKLRGQRGKVWAHRYHARALTSPLAVRRALVYVLRNGAKHGVARGEDAFSSAYAFDGFTRRVARPDDVVHDNGRTWLIRVGWWRHGPIRNHEQPQAPPVRGIVIWDYLAAPA